MLANEQQISALRQEAERRCIFDFAAFDDYREIDDSQLPTGQFFDDELKQLKSNQRNKQLRFVVLGIFFLLYAILVRVFMPNSGIWLVGGAVLNTMTVYRDAVATVTNNAVSNRSAGYRGGRKDRVASFTFCTVFFPDNRTYIKHIFFPKSLGQAPIRFGDKLVVYKLTIEQEARMMPTIHLEVPESLIERAKAVREARGISDQGLKIISRGADGAYVAEPLTKQTCKKVMKRYVLLLIIFFGIALIPLIAFGLLPSNRRKAACFSYGDIR